MGSAISLRREIIRVCRRLYSRGLLSGLSGNVSARTGKGTILVTPAGTSKFDLAVGQLVEMNMNGSVVRGASPSTEFAMHARIYAERPDVHAVVHAHPPAATALAVAGEGIPDDILPEIATDLGVVPLVPYARSGSAALADAVAPFASRHDAFLMANHGATTLGSSLAEAHHRMESLEQCAMVIILARQAGKVERLLPDEIRQLRENRLKSKDTKRFTGVRRTGR